MNAGQQQSVERDVTAIWISLFEAVGHMKKQILEWEQNNGPIVDEANRLVESTQAIFQHIGIGIHDTTTIQEQKEDAPAKEQQQKKKRKQRMPALHQCDHCKLLKDCCRRGPAHCRLCNACGLSFTRCKKKPRGAAAMAVSFLMN